jgi:N6-L-threonylcarbamoyladenine synthase
MTLILGIETSCDETAAAVVMDGRKILSDVVASQIELHAPYGGIFPEIASRAHVERIYPVIDEALRRAGAKLGDIEALAVTRGPGLAGSLLVGVNVAKGMALGAGLPLVGVNHLEGHLYSLWLASPREVGFPVVALIVSGGHTSLVLMADHGAYRRLGETLDDAAGEAFDKVGRMLGLPYPGGPSIQKAAQGGSPAAYNFPRAWLPHEDGGPSYDFSFSGLKTAVLREIRAIRPGIKIGQAMPPDVPVSNLAASFQRAVVDVLVEKTVRAAEEFGASEIFIAGGVSANQELREQMARRAGVDVRVPPLELCTDNAAMIAACGHFRYLAGQRDGWDMDVLPTWPLAE